MEKISDGVYHLPNIVGGPTILLAETTTLIDTGVPGSADSLLSLIAELGGTLTDIVITHADGDHVGSLAALVERSGARVWAPRHEADVIEGLAAGRGGDTARSGTVDERFDPGDTLPLHGGIETIATHGHTRGHISLFLPKDRILIAGDALSNRNGLTGSSPEHTADGAQATESAKKLVQLQPDTIVFGHGPSIVGNAAERLAELGRDLG